MKVNTNSKLFLKILSGVVALALWFAITYTEDPIISQHLGDISVVFEGEEQLKDNGLIIVNKDKIPNISAVIRGKRSSVISAMGTVAASCDVSSIDNAGENSVGIKYIYPTATITMAKMKTKEITLETQKLITRNIPIKMFLKNEDKNQEYIVYPGCDASNLRIKGAETDVYTVSYAKVEVDVAQMDKNNTQEYFYTLCDKDGNTVSENNIIYKSSETITVENSVYKRATLPVNVKLNKDLEKKYAMTLKSISSPKVDIGIVGEPIPEELTVEIKTVEENGEYKLELPVPTGVYLPEESKKITVTCELIPLVKEEVEVDIEITNNQDKKFSIKPEKIEIKVIYPDGKEISGKIKASVDAKDAEDGETLPVEFETPDFVKIDGEYKAEVYIK